MCVTVCVPVCLFVCVCVLYIYLYLSLSLYIYVCVFVCQCVSVSVCVGVHTRAFACVCSCACMCCVGGTCQYAHILTGELQLYKSIFVILHSNKPPVGLESDVLPIDFLLEHDDHKIGFVPLRPTMQVHITTKVSKVQGQCVTSFGIEDGSAVALTD